MPKIIEFLGYIPNLITPKSLGEKIVLYRKMRGLTQKELARQLGIDPGTLGKWERGESKPLGKFLSKIRGTLNI